MAASVLVAVVLKAVKVAANALVVVAAKVAKVAEASKLCGLTSTVPARNAPTQNLATPRNSKTATDRKATPYASITTSAWSATSKTSAKNGADFGLLNRLL